MASVLLMSKHGDGVPLALRLAQEKHIVKVFFQDRTVRDSLKGFQNPSQVQQPAMLDQYDLILYDMAGLGSTAESMKAKGRLVLSGGLLNDKLELDRDYGTKVAQRLLKISTPPSEVVTTQKALLDALHGTPKVVKPHGNKLPGLTLVGSDRNKTLRSFAKQHAKQVLPATVQERVKGIEISSEGWFDGDEFKCFNHTLECKRLLHGDRGPMTGCMGNVVWRCQEDELIKRALVPLQPLLHKAKYLGPIDVNCIVNEKDAFFLEFTPRFGYDAIQAFIELMPGGLFQFLWQCATGEQPILRDDYGIAVRLSMPPFPSRDEDLLALTKGMQVLDVPKAARSHVLLADVMKHDGKEVLAGVDGVVGCCTARSSDARELRRRVYRTIRNCVIHPDVQYREDIGLKVEEQIGKLKQWGWLDHA